MTHSQPSPRTQHITRDLLPAVYCIWAGLILGVSFIATPVKFQATGLTMSVALEVGKVTFHLFNMIEWGIMALIISISAYAAYIRNEPCRTGRWMTALFLLALLALQTFWLFPVLDIRADAVIAGGTPDPNHYHLFYILIEISKLATTLCAAWMCRYKTDMMP